MADIKNWTSVRQIWNGVFNQTIPSPPGNIVNALLADGVVTDMSVDGSSTAAEYEYTCPDNTVAFIFRTLIKGRNGSISLNNFFGLSTLTNGLKIEVIDPNGSTVLLSYTSGRTIKDGDDFALLAGSDVVNTAGAGDDTQVIRWTHHLSGSPLLLTEGQIFRVTVQDNLSSITHLFWNLQGLKFADGIFNDA